MKMDKETKEYLLKKLKNMRKKVVRQKKFTKFNDWGIFRTNIRKVKENENI